MLFNIREIICCGVPGDDLPATLVGNDLIRNSLVILGGDTVRRGVFIHDPAWHIRGGTVASIAVQ